MRASKRYLPGILTVFVLCLGLAGQAWATSMGKVNVTSHLGEPFFAEVPLALKAGETLAGLSVTLANTTDYRVLEMYRDPVLQQLSVNVVSDTRGDRVSISSKQTIEAPFFNLVLKVRRGRATQFKRYPVFLDLPGIEVRTPVPAPAPEPVAAAAKPAAVPDAVSPVVAQPQATANFKPIDGWARISRYGPIVYGDTLSTVARRLKVDTRYTQQQVMAALYAKNSGQFVEYNMNMIEPGAYLDVPTAAEVESISPQQAKAMLHDHAQRWHRLKKQPRFAAADEAQKNRYRKRVRVGRKAVGESSSPGRAAKGDSVEVGAAQPVAGEKSTGTSEGQAALAALRQRNEKLTQQLHESEQAASQRQSGKPPSAELKAYSERIKRLELKLARLQTELDMAREQAEKASNQTMNWLSYVLAGSIVLLLIALGYLMRRERPHPATMPVSQAAGSAAPSTFSSTAEYRPVPEPPKKKPASVLLEAPAEAPAEVPTEALPEKPLVFEKPPVGETPLEDTELTLTGEQPSEQHNNEPLGEAAGISEPAEETEEIFAGGEKPDPNVDYVSEADVYLRYGMDDEAIHQLQMAIRQNEGNADAHSKLVQVLYTQGDKSALESAIARGAEALSGEDLVLFETAVSSLDLEDKEAAEIKMLPTKEYSGDEEHEAPVVTGDSPDKETPAENGPALAGDDSLQLENDENLELGDLDWTPGEDENEQKPAAPQEGLVGEEFGGSGIEMPPSPLPEPETVSASTQGAKVDAGESLLSGLQLEDDENLEVGGLDWPVDGDADEHTPEIPVRVRGSEGLDLKPEAEFSGNSEAGRGEPEMPQAADEVAGSGDEEEMAWDDLAEPGLTLQMEAVSSGGDEAPQNIDDVPEETVADTNGAAVAEMETDGSIESDIVVDHLAEAEAHLRYGMDEEATHQIRLAIEQDQHNANAHCKLVQVLYNQEKKQELEKAILHGAEALGDTALEQFMETVSSLDMEEAEAEEVRALLSGQQAQAEATAKADSEELLAPDDDADARATDIHKESQGGVEKEGILADSAETEETTLEQDEDQQAFDVSKELDGLLADLDTDTGESGEQVSTADVDISPESLDVDMARSQLAQGDLEAAEQSFTAALDGTQHCEAQLGLAEIALQRDDREKATELLTEAEPLLNDETRLWFDVLRGKLSEQ